MNIRMKTDIDCSVCEIYDENEELLWEFDRRYDENVLQFMKRVIKFVVENYEV